MRKLKILLATLAMTLLMATPALAADINIAIGGSICTDCDTIDRSETEDNSTDVGGDFVLLQ